MYASRLIVGGTNRSAVFIIVQQAESLVGYICLL